MLNDKLVIMIGLCVHIELVYSCYHDLFIFIYFIFLRIHTPKRFQKIE